MAEFGDLERVGPGHRHLKTIRALSRQSRSRAEAEALVVEGTTAVLEALNHGVPVRHVVCADTSQGQDAFEALRSFTVPFSVASHDVLGQVASTAGTPPVVAVAGIPTAVIPVDAKLVVAADALADPGNAGTLLRITEASGADAVMFGEGSVDPWSPKVVRASAGAWARLPVARADLPTVLAEARAEGVRVVGLDAGAGPDYRDVEPAIPAIVVVGNESHGISDPVRAQIDEYVSIPMESSVESLNAAVAVAVVLFAWRA